MCVRACACGHMQESEEECVNYSYSTQCESNYSLPTLLVV